MHGHMAHEAAFCGRLKTNNKNNYNAKLCIFAGGIGVYENEINICKSFEQIAMTLMNDNKHKDVSLFTQNYKMTDAIGCFAISYLSG